MRESCVEGEALASLPARSRSAGASSSSHFSAIDSVICCQSQPLQYFYSTSTRLIAPIRNCRAFFSFSLRLSRRCCFRRYSRRLSFSHPLVIKPANSFLDGQLRVDVNARPKHPSHPCIVARGPCHLLDSYGSLYSQSFAGRRERPARLYTWFLDQLLWLDGAGHLSNSGFCLLDR